jgi:large subunit ribosomal protein L16
MLFEISGLPHDSAREALRLASHKLAIKTKFAGRIEQVGGE